MGKYVESGLNRTREAVLIALFAGLIVICSWISIPTTIPFTMQTFAVYLAMNFLGGRSGTVAVCVYLLLGLIGMPVYAGFASGIGTLLGPNGGYMIGWALSGLVMRGMERLPLRGRRLEVASMLLGLLVCYAAGTAWFMVIYGGAIGLGAALMGCVVPFLAPDLAKLWLAMWFGGRLKRVLKPVARR